MPNCFQLYRKTPDGREEVATMLNAVDRELCTLLGVAEHPQLYVAGWFDSIGFCVACVNDCHLGTPKLRQVLTDDFSMVERPELAKCLDYLEANFVSDSWVEIGRR